MSVSSATAVAAQRRGIFSTEPPRAEEATRTVSMGGRPVKGAEKGSWGKGRPGMRNAKKPWNRGVKWNDVKDETLSDIPE